METRHRPEGQPERKRSRDEIVSRAAPSRSAGRPNREENEAAFKTKHLGAKRRTSPENLRATLLPATIAAGIGILSLFPLLLFPHMVAVTLLVAFAIFVFGFVKGCLRATKERCFVAFDYLESLGPLRWFIVLGFFGLYFFSYLALWTIVQIRCAFNKPRAFLPWLGVQAFSFVLVFLGMIIALISEQMWQKIRPPNQPAPSVVVNSGKEETRVLKEKAEQESEPPPVTGDRETDRLLARLGGKNGGASQDAATQLAKMQPNQHRSLVAGKLAEALQTAEIHNRAPLIRALGVWGTAKEVPVLIHFLDDAEINTRHEVLQALGKLRDERAVQPALRCLAIFETTWHAEQALKAMGSVAEKGVLEVLRQPNKDLWAPAIRILKEIGTEQSIPALEEASQGDFDFRGMAAGALETIRKRVKK
ncbi:MAG TPA: HEAT repeat domain-containing protein [Gemmataceae bacterium]|jgi:hypothetical protein